MKKIFSTKVVLGVITFVVLQANLPHPDVETAVEQSNSELWAKFVDQYGIIRDFVGEVPTPEDCALGRPNALGWWTPIENGPFFTGLYLSAACERAQRSGSQADREKAQRLADGLLKCASVSDVPGLIARGAGTDGKCHYPLGSVDQTIPWYLGLYSYVTSNLPTAEHRQTVMDKLKEVSYALMASDWKLPCDGQFKGDFRGDLKSNNYLAVTAYLFVLRMMCDLFQESVWLEQYQKALHERPRGGSVEQPAASRKTRIAICAEGFRIDSLILDEEKIKSKLWIYVKNQACMAQLAKLENDKSIQGYYQEGLTKNAQDAMGVINEYLKFDNKDGKVFGHADWRKGYPVWFPQKTQADAQRLAGMGNREVLGERKAYERKFVTNPLAAAAIVALAGDRTNNETIMQVISHYDYSKLNLSEFFFAEVAYYAMPSYKN